MSQKPLLSQADDLLIAIDRYWESSNQPKTYPDTTLAQQYFNQAQDLISKISITPSADPLTNLLEKEAGRVLANCQQELADSQQQKQPDFATALSILGIQESELGFIEEWLSENLSKVKEANARLINQFSKQNLIYVPLGINSLREQAEGLVNHSIQTFLSVMNQDLSYLPGITELKDMNYIYSANSLEDRDYHSFNMLLVSIGVKYITRIYQGQVYPIPEKTLATLAHEILGHARNFAATRNASSLPKYMSQVSSRFMSLRPNTESIAGYFENQVFQYFQNQPHLYSKFNYSIPLDEVIKEHEDTSLMLKYINYKDWFGIYVVGKTGREDKNNQHQMLSKYCINPKSAGYTIDYYHRNNAFDAYTGNLKLSYIREIIYAFQQVEQIMASVPEDQKSAVEKTVLTGYWTRQGISDWLKFSHPDLKF